MLMTCNCRIRVKLARRSSKANPSSYPTANFTSTATSNGTPARAATQNDTFQKRLNHNRFSDRNPSWLHSPCRSFSTSASVRNQQVESVNPTRKDAIPWFLQEEEIVEERPTESSQDPTQSPALQSVEVPPISKDEILQASPSSSTPNPNLDLPYQLKELRAHLLTSSSSNLLSRESSEESLDRTLDEEDQEDPDFRFGDDRQVSEPEQRKKPLRNQPKLKRSVPIRFINPKSISQDDSYTDWIVIVQVRGQAGGMVSRVAKDIGEFLKYIPRPPSLESLYPSAIHDSTSSQDPLDQLLGPNPTLESNLKSQSSKGKEKALSEEEILGPRPFGMSRIEWREGRKLKDWEIQKLALKNKLQNQSNGQRREEGEEADEEEITGSASWKPKKILSREAQDGIRLLNESNPTLFNSEALSEKFRISKESIRRILKAESEPEWLKKSPKSKSMLNDQEEESSLLQDPEKQSESVRDRQNRRANERLVERREELKEMARLKSEIGDKSIREEVEFERITRMIQDEISILSTEGSNHDSRKSDSNAGPQTRKPLNQIFYEGLIDSSADSTSVSSSNKKKPSLKSSKSRGEGDWCLIDSGWCIVHVMTKESREKWDLERNWERKFREVMRERESFEEVKG